MGSKSEGKHMHPEDFESLIAGLRSVADYKRGKREGFVTHVPASVDVCAIGNRAAASRNAPPASSSP